VKERQDRHLTKINAITINVWHAYVKTMNYDRVATLQHVL